MRREAFYQSRNRPSADAAIYVDDHVLLGIIWPEVPWLCANDMLGSVVTEDLLYLLRVSSSPSHSRCDVLSSYVGTERRSHPHSSSRSDIVSLMDDRSPYRSDGARVCTDRV